MRTHTLRKHWIGAAVALGVVVAGGVAAGGVAYGSFGDESVEQYQVDATLDGDRLSVVETIDYDFGVNLRRGIFREVDLGIVDRAGSVGLENPTAATATADDNLQVTPSSSTATLRVGDPSKTFRGRHRYQLGYDLVGVPDPATSGELVYIAIGDRWEVPIEDVTVRVAPDFEPGDLSCSIGGSSSFEDCDISAEDGVVTANVDKVDEGEGVVLKIGAGAPREAASLAPPSLEADGSDDNRLALVVIIGLVAVAGGVIGIVLAGRWVRRVGADRTGAWGNPSAAAYVRATPPGGGGNDGGTPISDAGAAEEVTVQFAPPEGLTPPQGAVLERERADDAAKTAWLAQAVIDGWIELDGDSEKPTITHTERADRDPSHMPAPLAAIFDGRREVELGEYDEEFAAGWKAIGTKLTAWKRSSGLWDEDERKDNERKVALLLVGTLGVMVLVAIAMFAGLARVPVVALPVVLTAGFLLGASARGATGIPTLNVRNPAGYAFWLRTEGFRRFLAESEGKHARWAAEKGLLREYSAWAVALGELDHWNRAAAAAGIPPSDPALGTTASFVALNSTARTTSVQPKSSSGGGFSGGGSSGGVGGGGGGSW